MKVTAQIAGAVAFIVAVLLVPIIGKLCHRWDLFDWPGLLKIHSRPIPRLGGVAVAAAIVCGVLVTGQRFGSATSLLPFLAPFGLIWVVGLVDDLTGLSPASRIAAQLAAGGLLWHAGWRLPALETGVLGFVVVCLFVAILINGFNFLDGADGIAAGVAGIGAVAYIALPGAINDPLASAVAWSLVGACGAFLFSNFPPSKLFLGDSGSTALGFAVAFLTLDFYRTRPTADASMCLPFMIAGLPLLDSGLAVIRRLGNPRSLIRGDRRHVYDLLRARGWSARRVALTCYAITVGLSVFAWIGQRTRPIEFVVVAALSFGLLLAVAVRLGALRQDSAERSPQNEPETRRKGAIGIPD
jgi:UDP-GlcNAc:undecaprenyl-phosphate/decaprenyl-phosphate GlcNAc-1-phosphate transferase